MRLFLEGCASQIVWLSTEFETFTLIKIMVSAGQDAEAVKAALLAEARQRVAENSAAPPPMGRPLGEAAADATGGADAELADPRRLSFSSRLHPLTPSYNDIAGSMKPC